jgi:glycosyltransferase involved in cell wall biosynthesis
LAIVGGVPPPFGGVTIHILRLTHLLRTYGIEAQVINLTNSIENPPDIVSWRRRGLRRLLHWMFRSPAAAVVVMNKRLYVWCFFLLAGWFRRQRVIIRLQGSDVLDWNRTRHWKRIPAAACLRRAAGVVCVNPHLREAVQGFGVSDQRILLMPGFLPPTSDEQSEAGMASQTAAFLDRHRPVLAANGKVAWHAGEDLYGLDLLVDLLHRLTPEYPNVGLIVSLASPDQQGAQYLLRLSERAASLGVKDQILFCVEPGYFLPVLARSHVFLRPTNTEGDSNSVREALSLGLPVVASDVANRPEGTRLFRNRDLNDLELQTREALSGSVPASPQLSRDHRANEDGRIQAYLEFLLGRPIQSNHKS